MSSLSLSLTRPLVPSFVPLQHTHTSQHVARVSKRFCSRPCLQTLHSREDSSSQRPQLVEYPQYRPPQHPLRPHERWSQCIYLPPAILLPSGSFNRYIGCSWLFSLCVYAGAMSPSTCFFLLWGLIQVAHHLHLPTVCDLYGLDVRPRAPPQGWGVPGGRSKDQVLSYPPRSDLQYSTQSSWRPRFRVFLRGSPPLR